MLAEHCLGSPPGLLLLAGGKSSRMGIPKGVLNWQGQSLIQAHCQRFLEVGGTFILVVLGYDAKQTMDRLKRLDQDVSESGVPVNYCINPHPDRGQFSSLMHGVTVLKNRGETSPIFVQPVDMPPANPGVFLALAKSLGPDSKVSLPVYRDQSGHPVLLSFGFQKILLALTSPRQHRLDHEIRRLEEDAVSRVAVDDENIHLNYNYPADFPRTEVCR